MTPLDRVTAALEARGCRRQGRDWTCPAHDDRRASLSVTETDDGTVLVRCHAGCEAEQVVAALGLSLRDLFAESPSSNGHRRGATQVAAAYVYEAEDGSPLFRVVRTADKRFWQEHPDGRGGWAKGLGGARRVPYRLPKLIAAVKAGKTVAVAEGEKDVEALERAGVTATCNPMGAGKWEPGYAAYFRGAKVRIIADADAAGRKHAREVAASLEGIAAEIKLLEPAAGKDASDHFTAGKALADFKPLAPIPVEDAKRGQLRTLQRLDVARMVRESPPPVPWVIRGLVVKGMLTVLNGRAGEGKSLLAGALAAGVATGTSEAGMDCARGGVVILDAENGAHEIHRRVRALDLPPGDITIYAADGFDLRGGLAELERVLDEQRPLLLVLDSFRSLWRGDENDSREVVAALDPLRNLVRRCGAGTLLLHHSGKGAGAPYRGSSAIAACAELGFNLARRADDAQRDRRFLECWKSRPAPEPPRRWLALHVEAGRVFIEGADPPVDEAPSEPPAPVRMQLRPEIKKVLTETPQARADIARAVGRGVKDRSVGRVLDELVAAGEAVKVSVDGRPGWQVAGGSPLIGGCHPATLHEKGRHCRENEGGSPPATLAEAATLADPLDGDRLVARSEREPTLAEVLSTPEGREQVRASVEGEWLVEDGALAPEWAEQLAARYGDIA